MITNINSRELFLILGGGQQTCKWEKSYPWGGYFISAITGLISGGLGYATGLGAFGATYQEKPGLHTAFTIVSAIVMGGVSAAANHVASDCYTCTPNL